MYFLFIYKKIIFKRILLLKFDKEISKIYKTLNNLLLLIKLNRFKTLYNKFVFI
jgi:hypothetical protein